MDTNQLNISHAELADFCRHYPITKLSLFGSILRDDYGPESDIDILIEFESEARITFLDMVTMEMELTRIMGRQVDLRTPQELSRYFRQKVLNRAKVLYERAG